MDDKLITGIGNGGYYDQELPPGDYAYCIRFQNYTPVFALGAAIDNARAKKLHEFNFTAKPGRIHYFRWNAAGDTYVDEVSEKIALKELNGLKKFEVPEKDLDRFISIGETSHRKKTSDGVAVAPTNQKKDMNSAAEAGGEQSSPAKETEPSMANKPVNHAEGKSPIQTNNIFMSQSSLEQLFNTNRTAAFETTGHTCKIWFSSNGRLQVLCDEFMDTGEYRIVEGQYCSRWKELRGGKEACFKFTKAGDNKYHLFEADASFWGTLEFK